MSCPRATDRLPILEPRIDATAITPSPTGSSLPRHCCIYSEYSLLPKDDVLRQDFLRVHLVFRNGRDEFHGAVV